MSNNPLTIDKQLLDFTAITEFVNHNAKVVLSDEAIAAINKCRAYLDAKLEDSNAFFYGINTGFGYLQHVKIDNHQIEELQYNLLKSHACGMGEKVPIPIIRLILLLKVKSLAYGNSGVQLATVQRLVDMINHEVYPVIYTQGSLGASGDLAPLSHLCLPLIGLGEVWYKGQQRAAAEVWNELGWQPIHLQSKEGLALINGTQFMTAYGIFILSKMAHLMKMANLIAALSFDAFDCVTQPLHPAIHQVRSHKGQIETAAMLRQFLADSKIAAQPKSQVQDPYSFRCIPQVHGATADTFDYVLSVFLKEINSVTDNPNIFPDEDLILSGGNFHGQPLAITLDFLAIAISELANISERRTYQLISGQRNLPLFLVKNPGLHSGFMIPQYTAAGIVSENKQLCTPASVDSISSSNNQEDHVSMGANAATKCLRVINNATTVIAVELLAAAQALDFRRPAKSSSVIEKLVDAFRQKVSFNEEDRVLHNDMQAAVDFINAYNSNDLTL